MKASLKFWTVLLCAGLVLGGCCDDSITPENPGTNDENPPVEQPEEPIEKPLTDGSLFTVQLNDDIMATVGTGTWNAIAYGNGRYLAVGSNGQTAYSGSGTSWSLIENSANTTKVTLNSIRHLNDRFIAVGGGYAFETTGGASWTRKSLSYGMSANDITFFKDNYIVVGRNTPIIYSSNLENWQEASASGISELNFRCVCTDGNTCLAVDGSNNKCIAYSTTGTSWTRKVVPHTASVGFYEACAYGNGIFVVCGSYSGVAYSVDAINWTAIAVDSNYTVWYDITYEEKSKCFIMVGSDGAIAYSLNGIDWETVNSGTTEDLHCVCIM